MADSLIQSPVVFALITGLLPALIWLFFWLRTDRAKPEPFALLLMCFLVGAACVFFATLFQNMTKGIYADGTVQRVVLFAGIEELLKFVAFAVIALKSPFDDEAIDPAIYLISIALGFAALENVFYALQPSVYGDITASLLTGGFRFFGSTLLHTIASAFAGIIIGLSPRSYWRIGALLGIAGAIFLHTTFNFFILKNDAASFLQIYGYLWVSAIISLLILEKLRRLPPRSALA